MPNTAVIILAAGQGKRMQSSLPKPLVPVLGRPIIDWLLEAVHKVGVDTISVVVGHQADATAGDPDVPASDRRRGAGRGGGCR